MPSVKFGGFIVESSGFRPDPELTKAISAFPSPQNFTDLRSFFDLCQQVGNFSSQVAAALSPLSSLLKKGTAWVWSVESQTTFEHARRVLTDVADLAFYDTKNPTALHTGISAKTTGRGGTLAPDPSRVSVPIQCRSPVRND